MDSKMQDIIKAYQALGLALSAAGADVGGDSEGVVEIDDIRKAQIVDGKVSQNYRIKPGGFGGFSLQKGCTMDQYNAHFSKLLVWARPDLYVVCADGELRSIGDVGAPWIDPALPANYNWQAFPAGTVRSNQWEAAGCPTKNSFCPEGQEYDDRGTPVPVRGIADAMQQGLKNA